MSKKAAVTVTAGAAASDAALAGGADGVRPLTAVIVGGGLGGLAACVALRRIGIDAQVYERALALKANAG
jgi:NAD(P)H-nitrite reductase large subunit